jgi:hypothetical protein
MIKILLGTICGIAIILAILVVWFSLTMTNNYIPQIPEVPQIANLADSNATCQTTSTGWKCQFNVPNDINTSPRDWQENDLINNYRNTCTQQGGNWKCYGFCMPFYDHYCDFQYADAGELCISNAQCGSACIGTLGIGTCAKYQYRMCDWYEGLIFIIPDFTRPQVMCD